MTFSYVLKLSLLVYSLAILDTNSISTTATHSNATGDYYLLSDETQNKIITCSNPSKCYIHCQQNACKSAEINASLSESLVLKCLGTQSCYFLTITEGPETTANIECISHSTTTSNSCYKAKFFLNNTDTINFQCATDDTSNFDGDCEQLQLYAQNATDVVIDCMGPGTYACYEMQIYIDYVSNKSILNAIGVHAMDGIEVHAWHSNQLDIHCDASNACQNLNIWPPYQDAYVFRLFCLLVRYSCYQIEIRIPQSTNYADNYMEMICPRTETYIYHTNICNIKWFCLDLNNGMASSFDELASRWGCYSEECCPWNNPNNIQQNTTTQTILYGSIQPNITNSSGEWYILEGMSINRLISCNNSAGCFIVCGTTESCKEATIYAGVTNNLSLKCLGAESCYSLYISQGPMKQADIYCTSRFGQACKYGAFIMDDTEIINLWCDGQIDAATADIGNCYYLRFWAQYAKRVDIICNNHYDCYLADFHVELVSESIMITANNDSSLRETHIFADYSNLLHIECIGVYSCRDSEIHAASGNSLHINCAESWSCYGVNVWPPYDIEYIFSMFCADTTQACRDVDIFLPKSNAFVTNYMQLICPPVPVTGNLLCNIKWWCPDITSTYTTKTTWVSNNLRYQCSIGTTANACCPWTDPENMSKPPTLSPTKYPSTANPTEIPSISTFYPTITPKSTTIIQTNSPTIPNSTIIVHTKNTTNNMNTQFFTTYSISDPSVFDTSMNIFGMNIAEFIIIIVVLFIFIILVIFVCIYCVKRKNKSVIDSTMYIKYAMVIIIGIGEYDNDMDPEKADKELANTYLSDLDIEKDVQNLTELFGNNVLNYRIYPNPKDWKLSWTQDELIGLLKEKANELENNLNIYDGLIVCISSHGWKDHICSSDYQLIQKTAVHRIFSQNYPNSRTIPRIFCFDCCDGIYEHGKVQTVRNNPKKFNKSDKTENTNNNEQVKCLDTTEQKNPMDDEADDILDKGKHFSLSDIEKQNSTIWQHNTRNPDFRLVEIHAANPGFQSKLNTNIGSYMIYEFYSKVMSQLKDNNIESGFIGDIFDEIQNKLENKGKQQLKNIYNNNTRLIKLK
eukprot:149644_1